MIRWAMIALTLAVSAAAGPGGGDTPQPAVARHEEASGHRLDASGQLLADPDQAAVAAYPGADPVAAPGLGGIAGIPSNFDRQAQIQTSQQPLVNSITEAIGAFRFLCQPGQLNWDDPIVYPGQVNASPHLHQWFGNTAANGLSTYRSLRTTGDSTCMGPLNRSAYWIPAMIADDASVVRPDYIVVYYKRYPRDAPECTSTARQCLPLPLGLRYIFGYDMKRIGASQAENLIFHWKCIAPNNRQLGGIDVRFDRLTCPANHLLMVTLSAPDCWDGSNLDSRDHRSHVVYQRYGQSGGLPRCPATHPYLIPKFTIAVTWRVGAGENIANWHLSSDRMPGMPELPPGGSFHSDWFGAWDEPTMQTWTAHCIDRKLSCSDGQLGDGTVMRRPPGYGTVANPRRVPAPANPAPHRM
jgi:Domain of unknown function (DUF1996)